MKLYFLFTLILFSSCVNPIERFSGSTPKEILIDFGGAKGEFYLKYPYIQIINDKKVLGEIWSNLSYLEVNYFPKRRPIKWEMDLYRIDENKKKFLITLGSNDDNYYTFSIGSSFYFRNDDLAHYLIDLMQVDLIGKTPLESDGSFDWEYIRNEIERGVLERE